MTPTILTRVTGLRNPPPTPTKEAPTGARANEVSGERLGAWAAKYFSLPVEQRLRGVK